MSGRLSLAVVVYDQYAATGGQEEGGQGGTPLICENSQSRGGGLARRRTKTLAERLASRRVASRR